MAEDIRYSIADIESPFLVGHSLGGHLCLRLLGLVPNVSGLLVVGTPPLSQVADMGRAFLPHPALGHAFKAEIRPSEAQELVAAWTWPESPFQEVLTEAVLSTDPRMRSDLGAQLATGLIADETDMIRSSGVRPFVAHGGSDTFISSDYLNELAPALFMDGRVLVFEAAGHCPQLEVPERFNALLNHIAP